MLRRSAILLLAACLATPVLIVGGSLPALATPPGHNGKVVFTSNRSGVNQIYSVNPDGSALAQLTNDSGGSAFPVWSPDGTKIAIDGGPSPAGIYTMNADGSGLHRVTNPGVFLSWSGDGSKLAYVRQGNNNSADIFTINVDGTAETNITNDPISDIFPAWSPDGTKIVFVKTGDPSAGIWTMNADGSNQTRLTNSGLVEQAPSYSPDGSKIVFDRFPVAGSSQSDIWTMNTDGSSQSQLTNLQGFNVWPRYSPDGQRIVFQRALTSTEGPYDLAVMNADGSNAQPLASHSADDEFPDWQPVAQDPNGTFFPINPVRILDGAISGSGKSIDLQAAGHGGVPSTGVSAVVVNVTVTAPTDVSYLTVWPTGSPRPLASNLNFDRDQTVPNLVVVKLGVDGQFSLYNAAGATRVIVDVSGWYSDGSTDVGGSYTALTPARILDTRDGTGSAGGKIQPNSSIDVQAAGHGGVPTTGVSAVVVNLTVTAPTKASYLTAWPTGTAQPVVSNLNYGPDQTIANLAVVKLGAGGAFSLYNQLGSTDAIADVVGWYSSDPAAANAHFTALTPHRILDTRISHSPVGENAAIDVQATGQGEVPPTGVSAVIVNLTATESTAGSYLTAFPTGATKPLASNLNFLPGQTVPNLVMVKLGTGGKFSVYNAQGNTHVIADVVGWFGP